MIVPKSLMACLLLVAVFSQFMEHKAEPQNEIIVRPKSITNFERFAGFLNHIESKKADQIRIVSYTLEGDPIFETLAYNGSTITYTFDNSQDRFGDRSKGIRVAHCQGISKVNGEYGLTGCDSENGQLFSLES